MKIDKIIYESNTGFTKQYALMLAEELNIPALTLKEAAAKGKSRAKNAPKERIFFMGWLMAGSLKGLKQAQKRFDIKGLTAVGMASPSDEYVKELKKNFAGSVNDAGGFGVFYLQGGINKAGLKGAYKVMLNMAAKFMTAAASKTTENHPEKSAEFDEMTKLFSEGGSFVAKENLTELVTFLTN
jgi:hypothetical protein